jgi:glucokinase
MLNDVSKNKVISGQGLKDIKNFVNKENREMKREYIETSMLVM